MNMLKGPSYSFPNHLTYGFLAKHCAGIKNEEINSNQVEIPSFLQKAFITYHSYDVSNYVSDWTVLEVIHNEETDYLGAIYVNKHKRQLVLAHRSTRFHTSLTRNLFSKSGLQADINGVFMGDVLLYQAHGFSATYRAVQLVQGSHKGFNLSFTGHSLGAWLASLSVFYCHDIFNCKDIKAVTFDGPGVHEMMTRLRSGDIIGYSTSQKNKLEHLDITSYISAPNIVNCTNKHVGKVYRIYPFHLKSDVQSKADKSCAGGLSFVTNMIELIPGIILSNLGHDLDYILPYFNPFTGKPTKYTLIEKWPSITYNKFGQSTIFSSLLPNLLSVIGEFCFTPFVTTLKSLYAEGTTFDSVVQLALAFFKGQIDFHQFWLVQDCMNADYGFQVKDTDIIGSFFLEFKYQYKELEATLRESKVISGIDNVLIVLQNPNIHGRALLNLAKKFKYNSIKNTIVVSDEYKYVTVDDIRDEAKSLLNNNPYLEQYLNNIDRQRIEGNIIDFKEVRVDFMSKMFENNKTVIIKGIVGTGKTNLAKTYAKVCEKEFGAWLFEAGSVEMLKVSLNNCVSLNKLRCDCCDSAIILKEHLLLTKQPVLFILDDVKEYSDVKEFIEGFETLDNVKFLITTQHNCLYSFPQVLLHDSQDKLNSDPPDQLIKVIHNLIQEINCFNIQCQATHNILRILAFIKSNVLTRQHLIDCLTVYNSLYDLELAVLKLESISAVMSDKNKIIVSQLFQEVLLKQHIEYTSAVELLKFLSAFKPAYLNLRHISVKLNNIHLGNPQDLETLNEQQMLNIINCVTLLKNKNQFVSLNPILKELVPQIDSKLQNLINSFLYYWTEDRSDEDKESFLERESTNINSFIYMFKYFEEQMNYPFPEVTQNIDAENILVIGPTGSGKSTLLNYLLGNTLYCRKVARNFGPTLIEVIETNSDSAVMGHNSFSSETSSISQFYEKEGNIIYWDCPGFLDTRGELAKIRNAFLMKSFSSRVKKVKILLVVEVGVITSIKFTKFTELLTSLKQLCSINEVENSLILIINKCNPCNNSAEKDEDKKNLIKIICDILELNEHQEKPYTPFLKLLTRELMFPRIGLIPRIDNVGHIPENIFEDLNSALKLSRCEDAYFTLSIDESTINNITTLTNLLNSYVTHITKKYAATKTQTVIEMIKENNFLKHRLISIKKFLIPMVTDSNKNWAEYKGVMDEDNATLVSNTEDILRFFQYLNCNCYPDCIRWVQPLNSFNISFEKLTQSANIDNSIYKVMKIKAPLLSASEIQTYHDSPKPYVTDMIVMCHLFIVDKDLCLPGINLHLYSKECRIIGNREIKLKGDGENIIDSGSFYSHIGKITGGYVSFDIDGISGQNGQFDHSHVEREMKKNVLLQNKINAQINAIAELRSLVISEDLETKLSLLKEQKKNCKLDLKTFTGNICCNIFGNLLPSNEDEEESENNKINELQKLSEAIQCCEKLIELKHIYSEYESSSQDFNSDSKDSLKNHIIEIRKSIYDTSQKLQASQDVNLNNYTALKKLFEDSTAIITEIANLDKYKFNYYNFKDANKRINEIHTLYINNTQLKLSAKDLNELIIKNTVPHSLEEKSKQLTEKNKVFNEKIKELKHFMKKFKKRDENIKKLKNEMLKCHECLFYELERHIPDKYKELQQCIKELIKISYLKDNLSKKILDILGEQDSKISSSSNIHLENDTILRELPENFHVKSREPLQCVNINDVADECVKQLEILKTEKEQTFDSDLKKQTQLLLDHMQIKVKLQLIHSKKEVNKLVDELNIDRRLKYDPEELIDSDEQNKLKNVRSSLKKLWQKKAWFGFFRSFSISDTFLDSYVEKLAIFVCNGLEKINLLEKRLEYYQEHNNRLVNAVEEYKTAKENYNTIQKNYEDCKRKYLENDKMMKDLLKTFENYFKLKKEFKDLLTEQAVFAEKHLRSDVNLIKRVEHKWSDRDRSSKAAQALKEIILFNKQFYEKYQISGSEGSRGGNCGLFELVIDNEEDKSHIGAIKQRPGKGGEHSFSLEGIYLTEYVAPLVRGIAATTDTEYLESTEGLAAVGVNMGISKMLGSVIGNEIAVRIATKGITLSTVGASAIASVAAGLIILGTQAITSPIVANLSSKWVDGPYKSYQGKAENGIIPQNKSKPEGLSSFNSYLKELNKELPQFYNHL